MNDDDIQQIFFVECEEAIEATENGLSACKAGTQDDDTINAIFRGVHSIKGGAGAFGYDALQAYTHCFENLLGDVREDAVPLTPDLVDLLLRALDLLRDHVDAARSGDAAPDDAAIMAQLEAARGGESAAADVPETPPVAPVEPAIADALEDDLGALLDELTGGAPSGSGPEESPDESECWKVHLRPHAGAMDNGSEPLLWLRELERLGGTCEVCDTTQVPNFGSLNVDEGYLGWTFSMPADVGREDVAEIFDFVGDDCSVVYGEDAAIPPVSSGEPAAHIEEESKVDAQPDAASGEEAVKVADPAVAKAPDRRAAPPSATQSVRVDLAKLDKMIDGVGELVIAQAMLAQRLDNEGFSHIEELAMLESLVRDIQERAMAFRAQPISSVFGRVPRLLRELSASTGKHVKLEVSGETTELDKTVIERLSEPMTHLIRNAIDHGIEAPEARAAAGKPPEGTLSLSAEQKAGRIVIKISDDGRGIDRDRVLQKAIENGVITQDKELSEDEINQLIFEPGFSTAASITSVSGRGVGMDVVKSNVRDLGGRITLASEPGKGTSFTLALPLTLAISDGMIVQTGDQSLVIPLPHVLESLRPGEGEIKGMGTKGQMLNVRGNFVPVISLGEMTDATGWERDASRGVLVLVETESHGRAALLVDDITDQRQFVIKTLDTHYETVESVAGATILGNGRVALILDIDYVVQAAKASCSSSHVAVAA